MTYNLLKASKAPLFTCLKCPLCSNLVHEATTISECLHTFCKDCIYQELGEEESDSCPICNVHLGCSPLEKLRADRQLDDVCAKIFPAKLKKRKVIDDDADHDSPAPAKRKERSLSSLGIGVPSSANPGFVKRKTKSVTRRSSISTSKDTSTDNDSEDKQSDTVKSEVDTEVERGCAQDTGSTDHFTLEATEEAQVLVKKEDTFDEDQEINEAKLVRKLEQLGSSRKVMPSTGEQSTGHDPSGTGKVKAKFLTENSKASSTGGRKAPGEEKYDTQDRKLPVSFAVVRERTGKSVKRRSALAKLAEIAVDQAVKETEPPIFHVPRAPRGRGALESSKIPATVETMNQNLQERSTQSPAAPLLHSIPPLPLFKSSSMVDKLPVVRNFSLQEKRPGKDKTSSSSKQKERNAGFWFVLQAADSQIGTSALPQLSARYLRIKDGKLPISVVKKYLMKKLHLNNENEVEITCRGQPVVSNLPLESVRSIWCSNMPSSTSISSMKENHVAEIKCRRESHSCAEDYLMVLTYGQYRKPV
eukprot:c470_g1_i1 orf=201-1793(+)